MSLAALLSAALAFAIPPHALAACSSVVPVDSSLGFRARPNSERCEGLYVEEVARGGLDIVSLTFGKIAFGEAPHPEPVLALRLATQFNDSPAAKLRGDGMCDGRPYRMEADNPTAPFFLPTSAVLVPAGCRSDEIGISATRPASDKNRARLVFIPVLVSAMGEPEPKRVTLEVGLLPESDVRDVYWRVTLDGGPPAAYQRIPLEGDIAPASQLLHFSLPAPIADRFGLEVRYVVLHDGQERQRRFDVILK